MKVTKTKERYFRHLHYSYFCSIDYSGLLWRQKWAIYSPLTLINLSSALHTRKTISKRKYYFINNSIYFILVYPLWIGTLYTFFQNAFFGWESNYKIITSAFKNSAAHNQYLPSMAANNS